MTAARRRGEAVLETRGLSMHFGGVRAVDEVDFTLYDRELRCLIGPNGAGKSTFFKCLTGQLRPTAGEVMIRGLVMTGAEPHAVASLGVGIKTQVPAVFDGLTVEENIWLSARRWHAAARAQSLTAETVERLRLGEIRRTRVGQLAHGQRQWVELGMVLAAEPWLVLLDEPAAGMTDEETARTADLIREINATAALIVVEHDMQFIRMISRTVTLFHEGRILMEDTMDAIAADPRAREIYLGHRAAAGAGAAAPARPAGRA
jgi:branched-chain amino acid transport system ATP-binding protein/urea transport system ATP-binding protein